MKVRVLMFVLLTLGILFIATPGAWAQTAAPAQDDSPTNIYAAGVSYNFSGTPAVAGTGLYARKVVDSDRKTYAFTVIDALPNSIHPLVVTTNIGAGIAQEVLTLGKVKILIPTAAGISYTGTNTGWAWSTGGMAVYKYKSVYLMPNVRIVKSNVSNGDGYQPIVGFMFGWGN